VWLALAFALALLRRTPRLFVLVLLADTQPRTGSRRR